MNEHAHNVWLVTARIALILGLLVGMAVSYPASSVDAGPAPADDRSTAPVMQPDALAAAAPSATDCAAQTQIPQAECETLVALYDATSGDGWTDNTGWKQNNTPCDDWFGVTCEGGHVTDISLSSNRLSGELPDLSALVGLENLSMSGNRLRGPLPNFSALGELELLEIGYNRFSGEIPDLSNLTQLYYINLAGMLLTGEIPDLSNLSRLYVLRLQDNQLSGPLPDLSDLWDLEYINLGGNELSGPIPDLSNLWGLRSLQMGDNMLDGPMPDISNAVNLDTLDLGRNQLTGPIPELGSHRDLRIIKLERNQLEGVVPSSLCSLPTLSWGTDLGYNKLTTAGADPCIAAKDSDWKDTQTVPPTNLQAVPVSISEVELTWDPIRYTADGGYYEAYGGTTPGGPYSSLGRTSSKAANRLLVGELDAGTTYYFVVRTFTPAHDTQQNDLLSAEGPEATATTIEAATILVKALTDPAGATGSFTFSGAAAGTISDGETIVVEGLAPGTYSVTQADPAPGFDLASVDCDDADSSGDPGTRSATFIVDPGETVSCTFSNTQRGTIVVEVQTDPDGAAGEFTFTGDAAGTIADGQVIMVSDLRPGGYTVDAADPSPYFSITAITCDDENSSGDAGARVASFNLDPGETVTCTFAYTRNPRVFVPLLVGGTGS